MGSSTNGSTASNVNGRRGGSSGHGHGGGGSWTSMLLFTTILIHVGLLSTRYVSDVAKPKIHSSSLSTSYNEATTTKKKTSTTKHPNIEDDGSEDDNDFSSDDEPSPASSSSSSSLFASWTSSMFNTMNLDGGPSSEDEEGYDYDNDDEDDLSSTTTTTSSTKTSKPKPKTQNSSLRTRQQQLLHQKQEFHTPHNSSPGSKQEQHHHHLLPHWMVVTECSVYNLDCMARSARTQRYQPYPLKPQHLFLSSSSEWPNMTILPKRDQRIPKYAVKGEGEPKNTRSTVIPEEWYTQRLSFQSPLSYHPAKTAVAEAHITADASNSTFPSTTSTLDELNYIYPPKVSSTEYQKCIERTETKSTIEQLDDLLHHNIITVEPQTQMLAFTISDWNYVYDMMHDIIQMMDHVVGFGSQHFLMVAIDTKTTMLACQYGYPVIQWKKPTAKKKKKKKMKSTTMDGNVTDTVEEDNNDEDAADGDDSNALRDAVANTKVVLSYELVKRGIDFFFTEMDVWWIRSPKDDLLKLQRNSNEDRYQMYFSAHQNNPWAPNIGIYAAKANARTKFYFELCMDLLAQKPDTHDQFVMSQVTELFKHRLAGNTQWTFGGRWTPEPVPATPNVSQQVAFDSYMWSPHEIVGDERPIPTETTMAIHTLNGRPLMLPHGKKMVAREIGVYYGFETPSPPPKSKSESSSSSTSSQSPLAGYYQRRGTAYRRYLVLDSEFRTNLYSMVWPDRYHAHNVVELTMAIYMALAVRTNRILVLPQLVNADMDSGLYMTWNSMDYSGAEYWMDGYENHRVDIRETNFLSNPKSWRILDDDDNEEEDDDDEYWPFETVATTSLILQDGPTMFDSSKPRWSIWSEVTDKGKVTSRQSWGFNVDGYGEGSKYRDGLVDILFGALTANTEIDESELLLVNLHSITHSGFMNRFWEHLTHADVSPIEKEIADIYKTLKWCWQRGMSKTASKSTASESCYGNGFKGPFKLDYESR